MTFSDELRAIADSINKNSTNITWFNDWTLQFVKLIKDKCMENAKRGLYGCSIESDDYYGYPYLSDKQIISFIAGKLYTLIEIHSIDGTLTKLDPLKPSYRKLTLNLNW